MAARYLETWFTPKLLADQQRYFGHSQSIPPQPEVDPLNDEERILIEAQDLFKMATASENDWPYV